MITRITMQFHWLIFHKRIHQSSLQHTNVKSSMKQGEKLVMVSFIYFRRTSGHRNFKGIKTWFIGEGGQGVVHGCETLDPASTLKQVAVKAYKNPILVSDKIIRTGKFTV